MIPQTTELSQIQAAFIDKDNRIEELMRQINSAQSLLNSLKDTANSFVGNGKITIQTYAGSNVGDFTVNQKENKTITLPQQATVNNGTLTIQKNGTTVGTFTANQSGNTTANIIVPTKTSEITNDSDFVSDANYVHTDNNFTNADKIEIGKINNSLQFTYVVDNPQKLADWANNVAGNDYTSVLVKKGTYAFNAPTNSDETIFYGINLTKTNTKTVVGESGAVINFRAERRVSNSTWIFYALGYETRPKSNDHFICNLKTTSVCYGSGVRTAHSFFNCLNLEHCIGGSASGQTVNSIYVGFKQCLNVKLCQTVFETIGASIYSFLECFGVERCLAQNNGVAYSNSYSSPTANATYACANTLNGGWNQ